MLSVAIAYFIHWNGAGLGLHWCVPDRVRASTSCVAALLGFLGVRKVKQVEAPELAIEQGREIPEGAQGPAAG